MTACEDGGGEGKPSTTQPKADTGATADAEFDTGLQLDVAVEDSGSDDATGPTFDASELPAPEDSGPETTSPPLCDFTAAQPGTCGWSCVDNAPCLSGFCVPMPQDRVCTATCSSADCPAGWACRQLASAPDTIYGCVALSPNLGRPCASDFECAAAIGQTVVGQTDVCVSFGAEGSFCGGDCSTGQACPAGFQCKTVTSLAGKQAKQCVADQLDSNCTPRYEVEKAETACAVQNDLGSCKGKRRCEKGKLTACDAQTPAVEACNLKDDDCDGSVDEPVSGAKCQVKSGDFACLGVPLCQNGVETCVGQKPLAEACNGQDDNCDGKTDEGCDDDQDGWCDGAMGYDPSAKPCAKGGGDCADEDAGRFPGQKETCNGQDDNCNGLSDGADPLLLLNDPQPCENQKGVCGGSVKPAQLCSGGKWQACGEADYQKWSAAYGQAEVCDDKDNDCSGSADDGCDDDKDGYCDSKLATIGFPLVCPKGGGDCGDDNKTVIPGATEVCDDLDQNCNGTTDEDCDSDKDGQCDAALQVVGTPKICPKGGGDCADLDPGRFKGAPEQCNGVDEDCNGITDEAFADLNKPCEAGKGVCQLKGTFVCSPDGKAAVCSVAPAKSQQEICDNQDNDCDGDVDEGCDDDQDDYCDTALAVAGKPTVCPQGAGDCNDENAAIKPGAKELCDGLDSDCDGKTDASDGDLLLDDPQTCDKQAGACKGAKKPASLCSGGKWLACSAEHYGAWSPLYGTTETCDNVDNDCSGKADEGCDDDGDGVCDKSMLINGFVSICNKGVGDCNDGDKTIYPLAEELCDSKDNDCNTKIDDGCDKDGDNYCDAQKLIPLGVLPSSCTAGGGDCDDDNFKVNPGAKEICADFVDNNCTLGADDGCPSYLPGFSGEVGPDFRTSGFLQCAGYFDQPTTEDVPTAWGADCTDKQWTKIRVACGGKTTDKMRWIDVKKNVFALGIANKSETGLIYDSNFDLQGNNLIKGDSDNPNTARTWWVAVYGCSEALINLTVNNPSCGWEAANCFGQNIAGSRYLFVYVGK